MLERFVVGVLGTPFGLKGFINVRSLSGEYDHIAALKAVTIVGKTWEIEDVLRHPGAVYLKFKGINSPEAAKPLIGAELITGRDMAAPLNPNEYYVEDLKGLQVIAGDGELLGEITGVIEGGGGELAEVRRPGGALKLVPFRGEFFGDISLEKHHAVLLEPWILE